MGFKLTAMLSLRGLVVALCVLHVVTVNSSEDVVGLDNEEPGSALLGEGSALNPKADLKSRYIALRSDDFADGDEPAEADYYVRHLGTNVVLTTLGGPIDKRNGAWVVREPLCQPGLNGCPQQPEGTTSCVSLEAADDTNSFLAKHHSKDEVTVRKFPFTDVAAATFCMHPGHNDPTHISLELLSKPGFFVTHKDFKLALCNNEESTPCGKSDRFKTQSTFTEKPAMFFGSCEYKFKDVKKYGRPKCTCIQDVAGKNCNLACAGGCGDNGECSGNEESGEAFCKCDKGHVGVQCEMTCPVNEVTGTACGGKGECVLTDNKPTCKCEDDYRGAACQFHCPGFDEPGGICGGKGKCQLVENPAPNEPPTTCECEPGFLGGSCGIRCPVDPVSNKVCSGNGKCGLNKETGKAEGTCANGFAGDLCEFECQKDMQGRVCGGNGECKTLEGDVGGAICACDAGFSGPACEAGCPGMLAGSPCSGHGRCSFVGEAAAAPVKPSNDTAQAVVDDALQSPAKRKLLEVTSKNAVCTCDEGFGGDDCAVACPRDDNGSVCTGHGKCGSAGECVCAPGFVGSACQAGCPGTAEASATACNENGQCSYNPKTGRAQCTCHEGFLGPSCKLMCPRGGPTLDVCSARGKCVVQRGVATCVCEQGFMGNNCGLPCPGAEAGSVCGDQGHCEVNEAGTSTRCICKDGFLGDSCTIECPGTGEDGRPCNGKGKCALEENNAVCTCPPGFMGHDCSLKCPTDLYGNVCSGGGKCVEKEHEDGVLGTACECQDGYVNFNCDASCPRNSADGSLCSGHGSCEVTETTDISGQSRLSGSFTCDEGFLGDDCAHGCPTAEGNMLPCSGHGICSFKGGDASCHCESGWVGNACVDRACVSQGSVFLGKIDKCQCETGYTCCSREGKQEDVERDATIKMMTQQKKMARSKLAMLERQLRSTKAT